MNRTTGLAARAQELRYIDPRSVDGKAAAGSVAGYQYKFPESGRVDIVRSIQVMPQDQLAALSIAGSVAPLSQLSKWLVTLVTPDSTVLHKQVPVTSFLRGLKPITMPPLVSPLVAQAMMPRYYSSRNLLDLRQCYIECTEDNLTGLVVFRFQYAP
jgi:hypothetical protein